MSLFWKCYSNNGGVESNRQIGGIWKPNGVGGSAHISRPFVGVLAGVLYNGVRPLDLAAPSADATSSAKRRGRGKSTALGDVR